MKKTPDGVLRAVTHDGAFRVMTLHTTEMVKAAVKAQRASGKVAEQFAELLTAAVLVRESMSPDLRVQCVLQGDDQRSRLVADALPEGLTRGLVQLAKGASGFSTGEHGVFQVHRTLHNGALHQGVVSVPSSGKIADAVMAYMQESEQVASMVAVGTVMRDGEIVAAGGYLVQLLPELTEGVLAVMTERLEDFKDIVPLLEQGMADPRTLLDEVLYGMPFEQVADAKVSFGCNCSAERLTAGLATLPRHEIEEFVREGKVLEISCDFCGHEYHINPDSLRGLLTKN